MAKVPFSKLQASVNNKVTQLSYANKAGEEIHYEVKYYLPFSEKISLVSNVINYSVDGNGFYNPMRLRLYTTLEIVNFYTNLTFTDKMREDPFKMYDILTSSGIFDDISQAICENDLVEIYESVYDSIQNIYDYKNSVMGILDTVSTDYDNLTLDATEIKNQLSDENNLSLLRDVLSKLG